MNGHGGSSNGLGLADMRPSEVYYPNHNTDVSGPSTSAGIPMANGYTQCVLFTMLTPRFYCVMVFASALCVLCAPPRELCPNPLPWFVLADTREDTREESVVHILNPGK